MEGIPLPSTNTNNLETGNGQLLPDKIRDAKRLADVRQFASLMELFFNDNNRYPYNLIDLWPKYLNAPHIAPAPADGSCSTEQNTYNYKFISNNSYSMTFCLGSSTGGYLAGVHTLTQAGINDDVNKLPVSTYPTDTPANRDYKRLSDVTQIASTMESYFNDKNHYPNSLAELVPNYLTEIPQAPAMAADSTCNAEQYNYQYTYLNVNSFKLRFCMELNTGWFFPGIKTLTQGGMEDTSRYLSNSNKTVSQLDAENKETVLKVGKLILLPDNEDPTIYNIIDANKVKAQSTFMENAQNGDILLIFSKNKLVIVYRPSTNIIIKFGSVTFQSVQ